MKMRLLLVLSVVLSLAAANKAKPKGKGAKTKVNAPKAIRSADKHTTIASLKGKKPSKTAILFRMSGTKDSLVDEYFEALNAEKNIGMDFVWADEDSATLRYQIGGSKGKKYGVNEFPKLVVVDPKGAKYANVHMDLDKLDVNDIKGIKKFDKSVIAPLKTFAHKQVYMFGGIGAVLGGIIGFLVGKKAGGGAAAGGKAKKGKIIGAGKKFDKKVNKKGTFEKQDKKTKKWKKAKKGEKEAVKKGKILKGYRWVGPAPKAGKGAKTSKKKPKKGGKGSSKKKASKGKPKKGSKKKTSKKKKGKK